MPFTRCHHISRGIFAVVALVLASHTYAQSSPQPIPGEIALGVPHTSQVRISPSGAFVGMLRPDDKGVLQLKIEGLTRADGFVLTSDPRTIITDWRWAPESDYVIVERIEPSTGHRWVTSITMDGHATPLTPRTSHARVLGTSRAHPELVAVAMTDGERTAPDVWHMRLSDGHRIRIFENTMPFNDFVLDHDLHVRLGVLYDKDGSTTVLEYRPDERRWLQLIRWNATDALNARVVAIAPSGNTMYFIDPAQGDIAGLYRFERRANQATYKRVAQHETRDVDHVLLHPKTGRVQAVRFADPGGGWKVIDGYMQADFEVLRSFRTSRFSIVSRDASDHQWIVRYEDTSGGPEYFLYQRGNQTLRHIALERPELLAYPLHPTTSVNVPARDGTRLPCVITRPIEASTSGATLPAIVHVHDGPWSRVEPDFMPLHQFLASRGFVVLSVNYRGSTGFGKTFIRKARGEWTGIVADDLIDATLWLIEHENVGPDRVGVLGEGFGGTLAMLSMAFVPDFFAAGVSIDGAVNLEDLRETAPPFRRAQIDVMIERLGAAHNPRLLESISPIRRAGDVTNPVMIAYGEDAHTGRAADVRRFIERARSGGSQARAIELPDSCMSIRGRAGRLALSEALDAFLAAHFKNHTVRQVETRSGDDAAATNEQQGTPDPS